MDEMDIKIEDGKTPKDPGPKDSPGKEKDPKGLDPAKDSEKKEDEKPGDEGPKDMKKDGNDAFDRLQRLSAEFQNYKKRAAREMSDFKKFANEVLLKELLTVADNLERAVESIRDENGPDSPALEGVTLTLDALKKIFKDFHVVEVKSLDEPFDPAFHEAMMRELNNDCPENTVIKEMQKGYMIHDRLLRPALVVVSSACRDASKDK
ncbi:Protein GrpE [Candidatus Desulfarcum epimagneticum]|uniref:Protein GrpE n=1 Tax=uncultured Desulfobacteraceae bacterium TaxID=218296 RepID=A0A484HCL1_9BACT|nr:Protein GrpE [uncultured Desulfobacteraceae bacterium]